MKQLETPVLFIVFNRYRTAQQVFDRIREVRPKYLYVAADAPRVGKEEDEEKCRKTRDITKQVDWPCEVKLLFQEKNLGCGQGPVAAINWFFEQVEQGIILEDDVLPHRDFFFYCEELLNKYRDKPEVAVISGVNGGKGKQAGDYSYFFSFFPHTWGWATWRRTWKNYDLFLEHYSFREFREALQWCGFDWNGRRMWWDRFKIMKKQGTDGWDWQLMFCVWKMKGLCILPKVNLICNIGYGEDATHFKIDKKSSLIETFPILPLNHPLAVERDRATDITPSKMLQVMLPGLNRTIIIRHYFLWMWWAWRWLRRQILVKPKFSKE